MHLTPVSATTNTATRPYRPHALHPLLRVLMGGGGVLLAAFLSSYPSVCSQYWSAWERRGVSSCAPVVWCSPASENSTGEAPSVSPVMWVFPAARAATTEGPHVAHAPLRRDRGSAAACKSVREPLARVCASRLFTRRHNR
ncbi:hypothetical protein O3P69_007911 [Scylla paramamosain]|uniref:Secreted protein n=1 Tax=Scylla paramamosain TaxID=85552 RepID=A0AAW0T0U9_SCYPA